MSDDVYGGVTRLCNQILTKIWYDFHLCQYLRSFEYRTSYSRKYQNDLARNAYQSTIEGDGFGGSCCNWEEAWYFDRVDNTFATPYLMRPIEMGIDIVLHSTTKYLSGHNQIIGGAVITNHQHVFDDLKFMQKSMGAVPSPFDCWLTLSGIKTLHLRMEKHSSNGMAVAKFLDAHPKVTHVNYPGLESHTNHEIAKAQMNGKFSGMISFELTGGIEAGRTFMNSVKMCNLAESLGAVETMVTHPATMTHAGVPKEDRYARGLTDGLVRISVGIEAIDDINCRFGAGTGGCLVNG